MAAIEAERLTKPVENGTYFNQRDNEWQKPMVGRPLRRQDVCLVLWLWFFRAG